jgi:hypothetical protein
MPEQSPIEVEIKEALDIDETDILAELRRHSAKYFYYGVTWARSAKQRRKLRLRLKELESRLIDALRREMVACDPKFKVTEAIRTDYLHSNAEFLAGEQEMIQAEYMEEVLDVARDAMKQRGMALQELARQNRSEEMYGLEFKAMKNEYQARLEEIPKKRHRRTKAELEAGKQQEVTEI